MFPENARIGNGVVTFPRRGPPPTDQPPEGWSVDPEDDYVWILDYIPCIFRELQKPYKCPTSGKIRIADFCSLLSLKVNPSLCMSCTKAQKPTE